MSEQRWQRAENWVSAAFEDSLVMLEIERGTYVGLNDTAAAVWEAIAQAATRDDIVAYLRARFDVPVDACTASVSTTLDKFRDAGLAVTL